MSKRHEMLLFRYSSALERGDFDVVAAVLREAEHDATLEAMIVEMNEAYAAEQKERFNHTNHKEIQMLAPLYQNRTRTNSRSQSLLLIAAITLVAVMSIVMITQMRGNDVFNTGQPNTSAIIAQHEPLCEAITHMSINVLSLPSTTNGVVVGTIPEDATVQVLDQSYFVDERGNVQMLWYFIAGGTVQGWASPGSLDTSACPLNPVVLATPTPFDAGLMISATATVAQTSLLPTIVPPDVQGLVTFTPVPLLIEPSALPPTVVPPYEQLTTSTPVPFQSETMALPPTVAPPEGWIPTEVPVIEVAQANAETPDFPVYVVEEGDTLLSILQKFGFDVGAMRDMSIVNRLPENAVLMPGQAILLPYNMPDLVTTCIVTAEQGLMVWVEPTSGRNTAVTTLPSGTSFEITGETETPDEMWVSISAQLRNVTISGAWVRLAEMDFVTNCQTDFVPTVATAAVIPTPLPMVDPLAVAANTVDGSGCTLETQNVVDVQNEASSMSPVREQLPAGTPIAIIAVTQQTDGSWYMVTYRSRTGAGVWWGFIPTDMLEVPEGCEYWGSRLIPNEMLAAGTPTSVPLMTATPLPSFTPTPAT